MMHNHTAMMKSLAADHKSSCPMGMVVSPPPTQSRLCEKYQHGLSELTYSLVGGSGVGKEVGCEPDLDALLANAGYTVKASELAHVAQRLEQLESALSAAQEAGVSHLSSEAVHYNPSDLAGWIECMIEELSPGVNDVSSRKGGVEPFLGQMLSYAVDEESSSVLIDGNAQPGHGMPRFPGLFVEDLDEIHYKRENVDEQLCSHAGDFYSSLTTTDVGGIQQGMHISEGGAGMPLQYRTYPQRDETSLARRQNITDPSRQMAYNDEMYHIQENLRQPIDRGTRSSLIPCQFPRFSNCVYAQQPVMCTGEDEITQDSGIRLVHLLLACAELVQGSDLAAADKMVREIRMLASPQGGAMGKVAAYFVEALARRIYGVNSQDYVNNQVESLSELLYFQFYETCPYLKFAHFTANQAILEAFEGQKQVHVIDFNLMQGLQWPALIQALALRPGGPPRLRLTGIGPPQPDGKDVLQEIGMKLAQLADSVNVEFDFRGVVAAKLDDVQPWMLRVRPGEAIAVNSILQLHRLLYCEASVAPIEDVLKSIRSLNPRIITMVEQEANHNSTNFLDRFMMALHYYSTMFDSLEACNLPPQCSEQVLAEMYLGREICNIVACEGMLRVERHETLHQWRIRMSNSGFRPLHLGSNAFKQARMLLTLFSGEGYTVEENNGSLTLGWHSRPLIAASAWQCCS